MWEQLRVAYSHFLGGLHVFNQEHHHQNKVLFKNKNKIKQITVHIFEILCKFNIPVTCSSVSKTARSCRFALHNIRKIRPFLRTTGLHWAKKAHVTLLFISLNWLPVAARIKFQTLMLAYRTATGSAPVYFHSLMTIYIPSKSLKSASERCLVVPSQREAQNHFPEHSLSPFLAGGMIFPPPSGMLDPCQSSSNNWKLISFNNTWLHTKKKNFVFLFIYSFSFYLVLIWKNALRLGITSTSSVCLPL